MEKNIVLIGFMGTGKSSIGIKLAEKLNMKFVDMDREIEKLTGMTVAELFRRHGEIRFRSEEKLMAQKLSRQKNLVIATGGGVVLKEENIKALRENGILICLTAHPEDIFERVRRKRNQRPLLKKNLQIEDIEAMLKERAPFYAVADLEVNTSGREIDEVVEEIISYIKKLEAER
ncbi:shikimate kinase [Thermosyntropha lipolytica DSM 11003]|uniref:Shikimate kinase n=1 Tax=Thermosyntropha lipolytica DSM 11003 TaxID=1123382 RepID=A0A1M5LPA0_9FIRM|nr:shikimate kinase [Thermosyntropha lipolytica]SHG66855.1 shikimate kinase [Thermosyntropha lipolytica DSM 11003]